MYRVQIFKIEEKEIVNESSWERFTDNPKPGEQNYKYATKPPYSKEVSRQVFDQTVENLEVKDVIKAVNGL